MYTAVPVIPKVQTILKLRFFKGAVNVQSYFSG